RTAQRSLLLHEIAILNPGAVIFLTGPNYDREIKAEFPDVQFHPTSEIPVRMLARLKHPCLPEKTFRTYHPHYLQRARQWQLLEEIGKFVASS
ncbi:MAG TPA: hypothetical protein VHB50_05010, partial [Bryobacteraceae bacterium]|nr:hypothetical protein [Bryobacteraceae bacterium]